MTETTSLAKIKNFKMELLFLVLLPKHINLFINSKIVRNQNQ